MAGDTLGFEEIYVYDSAVSLNRAVYEPAGKSASCALITAEGGDMRFRVDGSDPTPSTGHLLLEGDMLELKDIYHIQKFRAVKVGSMVGKLSVSYEV